MVSTTKPIFTVNERVLCYHGPLIYEAKVLKRHHHCDETTTPSGQDGAFIEMVSRECIPSSFSRVEVVNELELSFGDSRFYVPMDRPMFR